MELTGAQILTEILIEQGVDVLFGYPGGSVLHIYDALYENRDRIRHILTAHEQGAAHAADGYARTTGKTGVVLATSGPGATNLVTGIATAYMDSIPMVCITGNVIQSLIGRDSFQEVYTAGITMPITKHNFVVRKIEDLAPTIRKAFEIANSGRKGPVLVDIPKDITMTSYAFEKQPEIKVSHEDTTTDAEIGALAELINNAQKPVICFGGGVISSDAGKELAALINKASIPSCHTIMATGVLGHDEKFNMGLVGMHGFITPNLAVDNCDLFLAVGIRFSDRVATSLKRFAPNATLVQIDIDESEINKNIMVDYSIIGDIKCVINKLLGSIKPAEHRDWNSQIAQWQEKEYKPTDSGAALKPHQVIKSISKIAGDSAIWVTDVGQHQMWAAQFCDRKFPRSFITSGGLGTMGFGYGAAIGSKIAQPDRPVIHITGDGSFHMNMNECCTAVSYNVPVITVIMNNSVLGMVRQWQHLFYDDRYSCTTLERKTDYVKLADAFGAKGYHCEDISQFEQALSQALKSQGPVIIDCVIDRDEQVLPMIPSGGTIENIIMD